MLGNTGTRQVGITGRNSINVAPYQVGQFSENSFPSDIAPRSIDAFSVVVAHEANHRVDATYIGGNEARRNRKDALLAQAGMVDLQYLRSQVGGAFFQQAPQEFVASIANQWFTDSKHTLDLGTQRFNAGYREPLNQMLFFVDLYSAGTAVSKFYRVDTNGVVTVTDVPVGRDGLGRITSLVYGSSRYAFTLDANGNVTGYVVGEAPPANDRPGGRTSAVPPRRAAADRHARRLPATTAARSGLLPVGRRLAGSPPHPRGQVGPGHDEVARARRPGQGLRGMVSPPGTLC
jgi:hypothetical protein